jgi:hypothetical protein
MMYSDDRNMQTKRVSLWWNSNPKAIQMFGTSKKRRISRRKWKYVGLVNALVICSNIRGMETPSDIPAMTWTWFESDRALCSDEDGRFSSMPAK